MKRTSWLAVGVVVLVLAGSVHAQPYVRPQTNPFGTPAISPYLNLARPGAPGLNYFNLVQPQLETNNQLQQLEIANQHTTAALQADALNPNRLVADTGHTTSFMSYNQYFQNVGGQHPTTSATTTPVFSQASTPVRR